jgi:hypothetical protein
MPASVVTFKGRELLAFRLKGTPAATTEPFCMGWGVTPPAGGPFTANQTDVAPFNEGPESRIGSGVTTSSLVTTATTNDTYQVVGTIVATGARTVVETFLSELTTKPTTNTVAAAGVVGSLSATTLNTGTAFSPGNGSYIQIRTEVMQVTAGSGTAALTVVRAQNGTTAIATIAVGDIVTLGNPPGTGTFGTTAGSLFAHADHGVVTLSTGDSIVYSWRVQVQS